MKFSQFFSAQRIIRQVLDFLQTSKEEAIKERFTDFFGDGVVQGELNSMSIVTKTDDPSIQTDRVKVDTGSAYFSGERMFISVATVAYDVTNVSDTTDDGLGNPLSTPHSTGSFDIPLTLGSINYLYIAYLQATDETQFTLHKLTGAKQFYKRTDGYEIRVNITGVNPDVARFILLGTVNMTSGSGSAIPANVSTNNRPLCRTRTNKVGIETANLSKTDRPASYSLGNQSYPLDSHIKAVGTGTVSPINPHGMTLADLGVSSFQTVEEHRILEHSNVLITTDSTNPFPSTSGMFVLKIDAPMDALYIYRLISGQVLIINGLGYDYTTFPSDQQLYLTNNKLVGGTPLAANTYQIVFDPSVVGGIDYIAGTAAVTSVTKIWLATVAWDGVNTIIGTPIDRRRIGGSVNRMQTWKTSGRPDSSVVFIGMFGFNIDNSKLEYWNGTTWIQL